MRYDVVVRYFVNAGSKGDRITPDEVPFVDDATLSMVIGRSMFCRGEWRDVAIVGNQRQLIRMLTMHHMDQIEDIARKAFDESCCL